MAELKTMTTTIEKTVYPKMCGGAVTRLKIDPEGSHDMNNSKWSDRSLIRKFSRKWNKLPIEIRKEKTKNKFKEKLSSEMVKLHERVPIDRQVRGFRNLFY